MPYWSWRSYQTHCRELLLRVINDVLALQYFLDILKSVDNVIISKPAKDMKFTEYYKAISLRPSLGDVVEAVVLDRLLLQDEQCRIRNACRPSSSSDMFLFWWGGGGA